MKRLMTTAATVIALSTTAYAQDSGETFVQHEVQPEQDLFASDLMGSRIYAAEGEVSGPVESSATAEWNDLGEINDMILAEDGSVEVVILGIGGFLGIGERNAAVPMDQLQIVRNGSDMTDYFLVVDATQEEIENAPEFQRNPEAEQPEGMEGTGGTTATEPSGAGMGAEGTMDSTGQSMDQAGENMENAAEDTGQAAESAADEAAQEAGQAAEEAGQAAEEAGQAAEDAAEDATNN